MKLNRLVPALFLLFVVLAVAPVSASLTKVVNDAPVFIGEHNLDLTACLNGHSVIAWWPEGSDRSGEPAKTVTISNNATSYYLDPAVFSGYTGTWYSHDTKPDVPVFELYEPQIDLTIWDVDSNKDITGQTVPMSTNITYRIDTNLYKALDYSLRPGYNPADSFFSVKILSPSGANIPQIYTGNLGSSTTQILKTDSSPLIKSSPYIWANGAAWYRNAKSTDGSNVYKTGTYTFVASQDLNGMSKSFSGADAVGTITSGEKTVTFIADTFTTSPTAVSTGTLPAEQVTQTTGTTTAPAQQETVQPTETVLPAKTTFTPLPAWIALAGLGSAGFVFLLKRKY